MNYLLSVLKNQEILILSCTILGMIVGSFLNVIIHRLPRMMEIEWRAQCIDHDCESQPSADQVNATYNLAKPRSSCPKCGHQISALENIPVVSWLALKGRCAGCQEKISVRYPLVEIVSGLLGGVVAWRFGFSVETAAALLLVWGLLTLACIDLDTYLLPDSIVLPLLWMGLFFNSFWAFASLEDAVYGAIAGYLLLWSVFWLFKIATGKEGMGYGDFKLLAALGAWFGISSIPSIVITSSFAAMALGGASILAKKRGYDTRMPFGPYLAIAGLTFLFFGQWSF